MGGISPRTDQAALFTCRNLLLSQQREGGLEALACWTGCELLYVSSSENLVPGTRELLAAMRHQYFIDIESAEKSGWYQLEVRTKRQGLKVRARTGYFAADSRRVG